MNGSDSSIIDVIVSLPLSVLPAVKVLSSVSRSRLVDVARPISCGT